jgi:hypothetical protein
MFGFVKKFRCVFPMRGWRAEAGGYRGCDRCLHISLALALFTTRQPKHFRTGTLSFQKELTINKIFFLNSWNPEFPENY